MASIDVEMPAFNLIEILLVSAPFEWWLPAKYYAKFNDIIMGVIYSPLLLITAWVETQQAQRIRWNRRHGEEDEDNRQEWEFVAEEVDFDLHESWREDVKQSTPDMKVDNCTAEIRELKQHVAVLTEMVNRLIEEGR